MKKWVLMMIVVFVIITICIATARENFDGGEIKDSYHHPRYYDQIIKEYCGLLQAPVAYKIENIDEYNEDVAFVDVSFSAGDSTWRTYLTVYPKIVQVLIHHTDSLPTIEMPLVISMSPPKKNK